MAHSQLAALRRKFDNRCHYCGEECNSRVNSPRQATKEHVVPRSYGGANSITNYVLACSECNNERGTSLFYCECDYICGPLIRKALESEVFVKGIFDGIISHNRHRVYKNKEGAWCSQIYHGRKHHDSWEDAMEYVLNYEFEGARNGF